MISSKGHFIETYKNVIIPISKEVRKISDYEKLYGPHIPGAGDNYWKDSYIPKIAFIGKDVGIGKLIGESLNNLDAFVSFSSDLINEYDVLEWHGNSTFGAVIINILGEIYGISEKRMKSRERDDLLNSFVWAQVNCIWNFDSWKKAVPDLNFELWQKLHDQCKSLNSIHLLLKATDFDIAILTCWSEVDQYIDLEYEVIESENHIRLLKLSGYNKYVVHTCHPNHWRRDFSKDPFYTRLRQIIKLMKETDLVNYRKQN